MYTMLTAHDVYKRGCDAYNLVVEAFGKQILHPKTGEIERKKLGAIVFADKVSLDNRKACRVCLLFLCIEPFLENLPFVADILGFLLKWCLVNCETKL